MTIIMYTYDGKKLVSGSGSGTNSGTAPADVDVEITLGEVGKVLSVLSIYGGPAEGFTVKSITGNKVTVTALNVAAGKTVNVTVLALGY